MEIKELWIAEDRYNKIKLFTQEPFSAEGDWYTPDSESVEIARTLVDFTITYETSPQKIKLTVAK